MAANPPASPSCLAHQADDAYMGFATREEIVHFLKDLHVATAARQGKMIRGMLPRIRDDVLHAELRCRLATIESAISET
ncbi:hypothetical protein [Reyranella sp.]|uniref:hypothetical protein n=1 Tax=Reyranella sp. TaxID=1929291 RepID=UPI003BA9EFDF